MNVHGHKCSRERSFTFNYILTGSYSGVTETSDALDKNSLASLLEGGLNNFLSQILLPDNRGLIMSLKFLRS